MYKVTVPLVRFYENFEDNIEHAKRLGAERIMLCPCRATDSAEKIDLNIERLKESIQVYENAGFETGVWISSLGHGGGLVGISADENSDYTKITGLKGKTTDDSFCPLDPKFSDAMCSYLKRIASAGAKMIMLDDDYRFSHRSDCGCTCKFHLDEYRKRLGENIEREDIFKKVFDGGYNKYRQVFYDLMGDTLRDFAKKMRSAIDEVNPDVRFSFCAVTSSWDCDGTDAIELAKIMAGNTKPFLRFIGAPYWANNGSLTSKVQYMAELERMQAHWCKDVDIEIFSEGDTYPRPRFVTPSAYLEAFDTILRADGNLDGILKYGIDYTSSPNYETGYADRAIKNQSLYREIDKHFSDKKAAGINVTCEMKKMLHTDFDDPDNQINGAYDSGYYQMEQLFTTNCSLPTTYDNASVTIAFGENGKYIKNNGKGFILDAVSAIHLENMGIDTGVIVKGKRFMPYMAEYFIKQNEFVSGDFSEAKIMEVQLKKGAEILSEFTDTDRSFSVPSCVKYENKNGQRFLIFCYDFCRERNSTSFTKNYMRQEQIVSEYEWLAGEKLPAICRKNPFLYIMAKKGKGSMAIGLWNNYADDVLNPIIELDKEYTRIEFINCDGKLVGDKVILDKDIPAYKFAGFEVFE